MDAKPKKPPMVANQERIDELCKTADEVNCLLGGYVCVPLCGAKNPNVSEWQKTDFTPDLFRAELLKAAEPNIGLQMGKSGLYDCESDSPEQYYKSYEIFGAETLDNTVSFCRPGDPFRKHWLLQMDERLEATGRAWIDIPCEGHAKTSRNILTIRVGAMGKGAQSAIPPSANKLWVPGRCLVKAEALKANDSAIGKLLAYINKPETKSQNRTTLRDDEDAIARTVDRMCENTKNMDDTGDGSNRKAVAMKRAYDEGLADAAAIEAFRRYEALRSFARSYEDDNLLQELRRLEQSGLPRDPQLRQERAHPALAGLSGCRLEPNVVWYDQIEARPLKWLWGGYIPRGCITIFNGRPGSGKSFVALNVAKTITSGGTFPDGSKCESPGHVLWMSNEEPQHEVIRPRMDAMGIDPSKVGHLEAAIVFKGDEEQKNQIPITLGDVDLIEKAIEQSAAEGKEVSALFVDNFASFVRKLNRGEKENVRDTLTPLIKLAEKYALAIILITHSRKELSLEADVVVAGDTQIVAAVRVIFHNSVDTTDRTRFEFLPGKFNLGKRPSGWSFRITSRPDGSPNFEWEEELTNRHADDPLLEKAEKVSPGRIETAIDNIESALKDGPEQTIHVKAKVLESVSERTYRRAVTQMKNDRRLDVYQEPNGTQWFMKLITEPQTQENSDEQA